MCVQSSHVAIILIYYFILRKKKRINVFCIPAAIHLFVFSTSVPVEQIYYFVRCQMRLFDCISKQ